MIQVKFSTSADTKLEFQIPSLILHRSNALQEHEGSYVNILPGKIFNVIGYISNGSMDARILRMKKSNFWANHVLGALVWEDEIFSLTIDETTVWSLSIDDSRLHTYVIYISTVLIRQFEVYQKLVCGCEILDAQQKRRGIYEI